MAANSTDAISFGGDWPRLPWIQLCLHKGNISHQPASQISGRQHAAYLFQGKQAVQSSIQLGIDGKSSPDHSALTGAEGGAPVSGGDPFKS